VLLSIALMLGHNVFNSTKQGTLFAVIIKPSWMIKGHFPQVSNQAFIDAEVGQSRVYTIHSTQYTRIFNRIMAIHVVVNNAHVHYVHGNMSAIFMQPANLCTSPTSLAFVRCWFPSRLWAYLTCNLLCTWVLLCTWLKNYQSPAPQAFCDADIAHRLKHKAWEISFFEKTRIFSISKT